MLRNVRKWLGICSATLLLMQSSPGLALEIQSLELQSSRNEPFQAIIRLRALPDTRFQPDCIRILLDDAGGTPLTLQTTVRRDGDRILANVRAVETLATPQAAMRVVAGCPRETEVFRSFLLTLPLADASAPGQSSGVPPAVPDATTAPPPTPASRRAPSDVAARGTGQVATWPVQQRPKTSPPGAAALPGRVFVLQLSTDDLDTSISARVTDTQRNVLKAYRRLVEADDSTARLLELEHRIRGLELELGRIRYEQPVPDSPSERPDAGTSRIAAPLLLASAPSSTSIVAVPQSGEDLSLFTRLVAGAVLGAWSFVSAWHVVRRRYGDRAARLDALGSRLVADDRASAMAHSPATRDNHDPVSQVDFDLDLSGALGGTDTSHLVLSDVDLFLELGRHESAIGLLRDELERDPGNRRYWEKLARIHAVHGHRGDWEWVLGVITSRFGAGEADAVRHSSQRQ